MDLSNQCNHATTTPGLVVELRLGDQANLRPPTKTGVIAARHLREKGTVSVNGLERLLQQGNTRVRWYAWETTKGSNQGKQPSSVVCLGHNRGKQPSETTEFGGLPGAESGKAKRIVRGGFEPGWLREQAGLRQKTWDGH